MPTKRDLLIEGLRRNYQDVREVPCRSRKYRQFTHPYLSDGFMFFGKSGAIRSGRTVSGSISVTGMYTKKFLG